MKRNGNNSVSGSDRGSPPGRPGEQTCDTDCRGVESDETTARVLESMDPGSGIIAQGQRGDGTPQA
jgi:hypothetical protein